jgi:transcription termination factor Rho
MDPSVLARKQLTELKDIASHLQMRGYQRLKKAELIEAIIRAADGAPLPEAGNGRPAARSTRAPEGSPEGRPEARRESRAGSTAEKAPETAAHPTPQTASRGAADRAPETVTEKAPAPEGNGRPGGPEGGARTRVRTRTRERTAEGDPEERRDQAAGPDGDGRERNREGAGRDDAGREEPRRDEAGREGAKGDEDREQRRDGEDESPSSRRRRSRRERRRNRQQGGGQPQGVQQKGRQGRPADEDTGAEPGEVRVGVLDILPEGYGFLRTSGYLPGEKDVYVSQSMVRKHGLRRGDVVEGPIRQQKSTEKVPALHHVQTVNGVKPDENGNLPHRPDFKDMTPLFPQDRLRLETPDGPISMRIIDLMAPIGKGQRGLIVSPPKAGKTTILKELGQAIAYNNPECHLMVVLVDERPEEVTDMQRSIPGEVIASTFDRPADDHTQIAELAMERAKRLVEAGKDVVILLDSITRLARAYNLAAPASGRIMSGGVDSTALYPPKRFFGAARNIEFGGSLTIIASALIETGSKMDEVIFEEFKGTGNLELRLDRRLEQKRIFPAIDIEASGTRKEELLLDRDELTIIWKLRRVLHALEGPAAVELLIDKMKTTKSNNQFLIQIQKSNLHT